MSRPKGLPKTGGRVKGQPNHLTSDVKAMILGALHAKGGQEWLEEQMDINPAAFMTLVGKVLPLQVSGTPGGEALVLKIVKYDGD